METEASLVTQKIPSVFYNMCLCFLSHQPAKRLNCFSTQRKEMCRHDLHIPCPGESVQMLQQKKNGNSSEKRGKLKHERLYSPQQYRVPSAAPHVVRISSTWDFGVHTAALGQ